LPASSAVRPSWRPGARGAGFPVEHGLIGRRPLGDVGATLDAHESDWNPDDTDAWDERIVMVSGDRDFAEWQREWLTHNGQG
jgi:hypothetical protein